MLKILITFILWSFSSIAFAQSGGYAIKEFEPGQGLTRCPKGYTKDPSSPPLPNAFECSADIPSLGGRPVKFLAATVFDEKVVAVTVHGFENKSHWAAIVDTLGDMYGRPNLSGTGYVWRRGDFYFMRAENDGLDTSVISGHLPSMQKFQAAKKGSVGR